MRAPRRVRRRWAGSVRRDTRRWIPTPPGDCATISAGSSTWRRSSTNAARNRLHPVTDQVIPHSATSGWTVDRIAGVLLGGEITGQVDSHRKDVLQAFALMSVETVVPAGLGQVPIDKIIEARTGSVRNSTRSANT
nr:DUF6236 family protein [Saccharopolyspora erythraea]